MTGVKFGAVPARQRRIAAEAIQRGRLNKRLRSSTLEPCRKSPGILSISNFVAGRRVLEWMERHQPRVRFMQMGGAEPLFLELPESASTPGFDCVFIVGADRHDHLPGLQP